MRRFWVTRVGLMLVVLLAFAGACLDPFTAPQRDNGFRFLVVDGAFRPNDTTEIRLSRTVNLGSSELPPPESGALIQIENEAGQRAELSEVEPGRYVLPPGAVTGVRMRLLMTTQAGTRYASDFEEVLTTPAIENVGYRFDAVDGLEYQVTTRAQNSTPLYLRWEFVETWMYTAAFESVLRFENGRIEPRLQSNFLCWQTRLSKNILIGSSLGRSNGIIANQTVLKVSARDEKVRIKHSVLVRQQAISREAFEYWDQLAKNSQNLGSLFDPIPSELPGNIRCISNPDEPVLGYFTAAVTADRRAFFDASTVPNRPAVDLPFEACRLDTIRNLANFNSGIYEIVTALPFQLGFGFTYTIDDCIDCEARGGTTKKPPFWE